MVEVRGANVRCFRPSQSEDALAAWPVMNQRPSTTVVRQYSATLAEIVANYQEEAVLCLLAG